MIRLATPEDGLGIAANVKEVFDEYGFIWEEEDYNADLFHPEVYLGENGQFWVAEDEDGIIVGCGGIAWHDTIPGAPGETALDEEGVIRISATGGGVARMYVRPRARHRGIASQIMRLIDGAARERGLEHVEIWSDKKFDDAHRLYQKFGAKIVADRISTDPDQSPEWGFIWTLT
ncbi:MAG: GNAT family N-acetyltransferase [Armatimonadetes bacterium]|nr:GNAT family N-acetyltransferase [Armatimonadota bacterium]